MDIYFNNFLFTKHIFVAGKEPSSHATAALIALASEFSIRITKGAELADEDMIRTAARNLGRYVPESFYRGFPESVRELTSDQILFDQLMHYTSTYGLGHFDRAGHSVLETVYDRIDFEEHTEVKDFEILTEEEATEKLKELFRDLLSGNRPLNPDMYFLVACAWTAYGKDILPEWIPCKDTVIRLLYGSKDLRFLKYLRLSDTIKLLQHIQYNTYNSENLKKLNLRNQDRKFLTNVFDWYDAHGEEGRKSGNWSNPVCDWIECYEKRKIWCGLFHHLHYKSKYKDGLMAQFMQGVRSNKNVSCYHHFERLMQAGLRKEAAAVLVNLKGESELIRHLNYILSRCESEEEIEEVLKCL